MENKRRLRARYLAAGALGVLLLTLLDQWTKQLAVRYLAGTEGKDLIEGVLRLQYLENRGMAFGMFQDKQIFFYIMTAVIVPVLIWLYCKLPMRRRFLPLHILGATLTAGALGNFIDRVRLKYVVDFIYFELIDFPVFNVADIYVTVSVAALFALILFVYKEDELSFPGRKKEGGKNE